MISSKKLLLLSILSGILLYLAWPPMPLTFILFFAFVPLLQIEHVFASGQTNLKRSALFGLAFLAFLIWNVTTTWWVCNASIGGGVMANLANSLLMAMVFWIFHITKLRLLTGNWLALRSFSAEGRLSTANCLLPVFWIAYEFFHHRWDLTWPWLALGNAMAQQPAWIQWYEYTGVPGGTLWVLALNLLFFEWINGKPGKAYVIAPVMVLPIALSLFMYSRYVPENSSAAASNIVVVQPNIDPYGDKFGGMDFEKQLNIMLDLAKEKLDSTTDYLVFPETALTEEIWENDIDQTTSIRILKEFLKPYPKLKIITGAATRHFYEPGEKPSITAKKFRQQDGYYDDYNTALQIDNSGKVLIYHKSKLVPGVERMPYPAVFGFLEDLAIDLGGTAGSLGTQETRDVFPGKEGIAPVVCYESIYGEYVGDYINNGATLIFIITNDGWWLDTDGYKQHLLYGRLRAIETRKPIARSANTGISCFINERGDISQETEWWKPAVIQAGLSGNSEKTFYTKHGDIIGRMALYGSGIILLLVIALRFTRRKVS